VYDWPRLCAAAIHRWSPWDYTRRSLFQDRSGPGTRQGLTAWKQIRVYRRVLSGADEALMRKLRACGKRPGKFSLHPNSVAWLVDTVIERWRCSPTQGVVLAMS